MRFSYQIKIRDQRSRCSLQDARWGRSTGIAEACQALELPAAPPALQAIRDSARPVEFTQNCAHIKLSPYRWVRERQPSNRLLVVSSSDVRKR